mgnify:CR=1 FL=1
MSVFIGDCTCGTCGDPCIFARKRINAWMRWNGFQTALNFTEDQTDILAGLALAPPLKDAEDLICGSRWLKFTVRTSWNNTWDHDDPADRGDSDDPEDTPDDTYVYEFPRHNAEATPVLTSETHAGYWKGDAWDQSDGAGIVDVFSITVHTANSFTVHIEFHGEGQPASTFIGDRIYTLENEFTFQNLATDLAALIDGVVQEDYPWPTVMDADLTQQSIDIAVAWLNETDMVQWSVLGAITTTGAATPDAYAFSDAPDGGVLTVWQWCGATVPPDARQGLYEGPPPIAAGNDLYFDSGLVYRSIVDEFGQLQIWASMAKSYLKQIGPTCYTQNLRSGPAVSGLIDPDLCELTWEVEKGYYAVRLSCGVEEVPPPTAKDTEDFVPGIKRLVGWCGLKAWWKFEENSADPNLDALNNIALQPSDNSQVQVAGKINFASELQSASSGDAKLTQTGEVAQLAYTGNGMNMAGWFKVSMSDDPAADDLKFIVGTNTEFLELRIHGGNASGILAGAASISQSFTPEVGEWYFFRLGYTEATHKLSFSLNGGTVYTTAAHILPISTAGHVKVSFTAGATESRCALDELAVFTGSWAEATTTFLYRSGAGRGYPWYP